MEASNTFFTTWVLWQQMTFVLGGAIFAVFCVSLVKLWWISRLMKKQEILDEEKNARIEDMRRTGIPPKKANDIPFGIRAIQTGVEVAGIWISRPESPHPATPAKLAPSVTIVNLDSEKGTDSSDELKTLPNPNPRATATNGSIIPRLVDVESTDGSQSTAPLAMQPTSRPPNGSQPGANMLSEDTLRKLEGQSRQRTYDTYMPASAPPNPRHVSQRSTESSSGESMDSQPRSFKTASGRSYTSSRSSRLYMTRGRATFNGMPHGWQTEELRDPFGTPGRSHSGFSTFSHGDPHGIPHYGRELLTPEPAFGQGEVHVARVARRVNDGIEVLPVGTFATLNRLNGNTGSSNTDTSEGMEQGLHTEKLPKKLRKKSIGQLQQNGHGLDGK